jgi:phosphate transport system substrate-binding protein
MKRYFYNFVLLIYTCVFIFACSPAPTQPPHPTPQTLTVSYTLALKPLLDALNVCAIQQPEIALVVNEVPAPHLDIHKSDLALRIGLPEDSKEFSTPLGMEEIVIIAHPSNPVETMNIEDVINIFTGFTTSWTEINGNDLEIEIWINLTDDDIHQAFQKRILDTLSPATMSQIAPDPAAMLTAVGNNPSAIGYLPRSWLSEEVKTIDITSHSGDLLRQPLLALSVNEPTGNVRTFLVCLQSGIGQEIINDIYK